MERVKHFSETLNRLETRQKQQERHRGQDERRAAQAESDKKKAEGGDADDDATNLRNQFNFSERASQQVRAAHRRNWTAKLRQRGIEERKKNKKEPN